MIWLDFPMKSGILASQSRDFQPNPTTGSILTNHLENRFGVQKIYSSDESETRGQLFLWMFAGETAQNGFFTTFEENRRSGFNLEFGILAAMMTQLRLQRAMK
jgi:hypothetical protein